MTRVILFDVMDTIVVDPFFTVFPRLFGGSLHELKAVVAPNAWPRFEKGEIDEDAYLKQAFTDGRTLDGAALRAALVDAYRFVDGMEELLASLAARGHEMHILSNYPVWSLLIDEKLALSRYLPWTFVSWKTRARKPDAASYRAAIDALGRRPDELVFVDDREVNVAAARALGIDGIRFTDAVTLRAELAARGLVG